MKHFIQLSENLILMVESNLQVPVEEIKKTPMLFDLISPMAPVVEENSMGRFKLLLKVKLSTTSAWEITDPVSEAIPP